MRVVVATGLYPPEIGGPATYSVLLEQELPKYGHQVTVLPFSRSRQLPKVLRHFHYFFVVWRQALRADAVFAQDVASAGLPALCAARLSDTKFLVRVPGDYAWEQSTQRYGVQESIDEFQLKKYSFKIEALRTIQKVVTKYADAVVTPSNYFKNLVSGWGVSPNKIHTIYNGVNLNISPVQPQEKINQPIILSAGRLVPWKGFATLITLMKDLPGWELVILGEGRERESLESLAQECGVADRVDLIGQVSREEVCGWCQVADVFVLNTTFESFSYQIVEAMASGVPVVTTRVGSLPELITDGTHGILVEPNDTEALRVAIKSVQTEPETWQKRTKAAVEQAQSFSIEATSQRVDALLKEII